jgi:hypothetical protein
MATAGSFYADNETGDHLDQPTPEALAGLIADLNSRDNTFVTLLPDTDDPTWYASVTIEPNGHYQIERRDTTTGEHHSTTNTDQHAIAADLVTWATHRQF